MRKPNIGDIVGYTSYNGTKHHGIVIQKKRNGFMVDFFGSSHVSQFWVDYERYKGIESKWFIVD